MIINWGDAPFKAFITVTYPRGTCTVTNGTESYTHTGGGTTTFTVKKRGTWTVKISTGSISKSQNVNVSRIGQIEKVNLSYKLYLLDVSPVTAWSSIGLDYNSSAPGGHNAPTITQQSDGVLVSQPRSAGGLYATAYNLTDYTTLKILYDRSTSNTQNPEWYSFNVWSKLETYVQNNIVRSATVGGASGSNLSASHDISGLSGTHYMGLGFYQSRTQIKIKQCWLE